MRYHFDTTAVNVCPRRRILDIKPYQRHLVELGHEFTEEPFEADKVCLFTCAFNQPQEEDSIAAIKEYQRLYGDKLVVAGCLPSIDISKVRHHFTGEIVSNIELRKVDFKYECDKDIAVSRGCLGSCSYCVDRKAVGKLQSRLLEECIEDLRTSLEKGHRSFRIVSDDLGAWGQDIGSDFTVLLETLITLVCREEEAGYSLHILELNANWLGKYHSRLDVFSSPIITSVLIGVQSASDRILKLMKRDYTVEEAYKILCKLKRLGKQVGLHIIIGFPTETQQEFEESLKFIISTQVDFGFLFGYSNMDGTLAHGYYPKVKDIDDRMKRAAIFLGGHGYRVFLEEKEKIRFTLRQG